MTNILIPRAEKSELKNSGANIIRFYKVGDPYGEFSTFSTKYPLRIDGETWPTVEHYYQAMKFESPEIQRMIRKMSSPHSAALYGRTDSAIREDWDSIRFDVMLGAIRAKTSQHYDFRLLLLSTGNAVIVEQVPKEAPWGYGHEKNLLGLALMKVRNEITTRRVSTFVPSFAECYPERNQLNCGD